jgi:DNA-binding transcriptional regulator PaaX
LPNFFVCAPSVQTAVFRNEIFPLERISEKGSWKTQGNAQDQNNPETGAWFFSWHLLQSKIDQNRSFRNQRFVLDLAWRIKA